MTTTTTMMMMMMTMMKRDWGGYHKLPHFTDITAHYEMSAA